MTSTRSPGSMRPAWLVAGPYPYRHRAGAGPEHRREEPPLPGSHHRRSKHRLSGSDRHAHRVPAKQVLRLLFADEDVPLAHRIDLDLEGRQVLFADEGPDRQGTRRGEHPAGFRRVGG